MNSVAELTVAIARRPHRPLLSVALFLLASCAAHAANKADLADELVREFVQTSATPGLAVSIGACDRIVWSAGFGYADVEQQVVVDPGTTRFRVGSVAKPFTALALVTLATQDRVDLDADARQYVPGFPAKAHPFSVRQLAGHLAGIRHYAGDESLARKHYDSVADGLSIFADDALIAVPGSQWRYSSYGYNLLSVVIEAAAQQPFPDYMTATVFEPLGMASTVADQIAEIVPQRGRYYRLLDGRLYNEPEVDNSHKWASGGYLSTTEDLVRFGLAHLDGGLVSAEMKALLWTEQQTDTGQATGYGIGWRIATDADGNRWLGHGGGAIGGTTSFWLLPDSGLVIAVAANLSALDFGDLLVSLHSLFVAEAAICD